MEHFPTYPGPIDPYVLHFQLQHRSENVWQDPDTPKFKVRTNTKGFSKGRIDGRVQELLMRAGFYGVFKTGKIVVDLSVVTAFVERWRPETHTFHLPIGETTITLQDVSVLWGLPIDDLPVTGVDVSRTAVENQQLCLELLGFSPDAGDFEGYRLALKAIHKHIEAHPLTAASGEVKVLQHARCRLMQLLGYVFADQSGMKVKLLYLPFLRDLDQAGTYSWGSAVLASLYREMCKAAKKTVTGMAGPVLLIQLWAWERLPKLRPELNLPHTLAHLPDAECLPLGPRACVWRSPKCWDTVGTHTLRLYRDQLDYLLPDEFIWEPYTQPIISQLPDYCRRDHAIWHSDCPLINFDVVEYHYPGRVMRQFGLSQEIPEPIDASQQQQLHRTSRQGLKGLDWSRKHADHILRWNNRRDQVLRGTPEYATIGYHSPYMAWYRNNTRLLVGNPAHRPAHGARPVAAVHELWADSFVQIHTVLTGAMANLDLSGMQQAMTEASHLSSYALHVGGEDRRLTSAHGGEDRDGGGDFGGGDFGTGDFGGSTFGDGGDFGGGGEFQGGEFHGGGQHSGALENQVEHATFGDSTVEDPIHSTPSPLPARLVGIRYYLRKRRR